MSNGEKTNIEDIINDLFDPFPGGVSGGSMECNWGRYLNRNLKKILDEMEEVDGYTITAMMGTEKIKFMIISKKGRREQVILFGKDSEDEVRKAFKEHMDVDIHDDSTENDDA